MAVLTPPPATAIGLPRDAIEDFCRRWRIADSAIRGLVPRADFGPESEVDFLVTFAPEARWGPIDKVGMN